jgi:WD40 repeat protein
MPSSETQTSFSSVRKRCVRRQVLWLILTSALLDCLHAAHASELVLQTAHIGDVNAIAYSFDKSLVITSGRDGYAKVWQVSDGLLIRSIATGSDAETALFTRDSRHIIVANTKGISYWDISSGRQELFIPTSDPVTVMQLDPSGTWLATGDYRGEVQLWRVGTGQRRWRRRRQASIGAVLDLRFIDKTNELAIVGARTSYARLNVLDGTMDAFKLMEPLKSDVEFDRARLTSEGNVLFSASGLIGLWPPGSDLTWWKKLDAGALAISPNSDEFACSCGQPKELSHFLGVFSVSSGEVLKREPPLLAMSLNYSALAFSPDRAQLAAYRSDSGVLVVDMSTNELSSHFWRPIEKPLLSASTVSQRAMPSSSIENENALAPMVTNSFLLARKGTMLLQFDVTSECFAAWDLIRGAPVRDSREEKLANHGFLDDQLKFLPLGRSLHPDSGFFAVGSTKGDVAYSPSFNAPWTFLPGHVHDHMDKRHRAAADDVLRTSVDKITISDDERFVASGTMIGNIKLWDIKTGGLKHEFKMSHSLVSISISHDSKLMAVAEGKTTSVTVWNVENGRREATLDLRDEQPSCVSFQPNGTLLAIGYEDGTIAIWSTKTKTLQRTVQPYFNNTVNALTFIGDSRLLSASNNGSIDIWDEKLVGLASLTIWDKGRTWVAYTNRGSFDGVPRGWNRLYWRVNDDAFIHLPIDLTFESDFAPALVARVLTSTFVERAVTPRQNRPVSMQLDLTARTRNSPVAGSDHHVPFLVSGLSTNEAADDLMGFGFDLLTKSLSLQAHPDAPDALQKGIEIMNRLQGAADNTDFVTYSRVELKIKPAVHLGAQAALPGSSVRLFRNGSLVKEWRNINLPPEGLSTEVPIISGANRFTAYAYDKFGTKGTESDSLLINGARHLDPESYVISFGIDKYEATGIEPLEFAENDAEDFSKQIGEQQNKSKQFATVHTGVLTSTGASKNNILAALHALTGDATEDERALLRSLHMPLRAARAEDTVFIYFSGHSFASGDRFYFLASDFRGLPGVFGSQSSMTTTPGVLSDLELSEALEGLDVRHLILVFDSCQSGIAASFGGRSPGPWNFTGLAQLAYDKGAYVITASQGLELTYEDSELRHGLLTYVLLEGGLDKAQLKLSPREPVDVIQWFAFASKELPRILGESPRVLYRTDLEDVLIAP